MKTKYPSPIVTDLLRLIAYAISKPLWFIQFKGRENIPAKGSGGFVIVSNHQTFLDPVWITLPMRRRRIRFLAFDRAFDWRFLGRFIRYLGAFPVSLDAGGAVKAMRESVRSLREGSALVVFPEGGRAFADGAMSEFKVGAVRIAAHAGVPILPVTISGGNQLWPQGQSYPKPFRPVSITYHPPVYLDDREDPATQTNILRQIIDC